MKTWYRNVKNDAKRSMWIHLDIFFRHKTFAKTAWTKASDRWFVSTRPLNEWGRPTMWSKWHHGEGRHFGCGYRISPTCNVVICTFRCFLLGNHRNILRPSSYCITYDDLFRTTSYFHYLSRAWTEDILLEPNRVLLGGEGSGHRASWQILASRFFRNLWKL